MGVVFNRIADGGAFRVQGNGTYTGESVDSFHVRPMQVRVLADMVEDWRMPISLSCQSVIHCRFVVIYYALYYPAKMPGIRHLDVFRTCCLHPYL